MQDIFKNYIQSVSSKFSHEETTELGYRADLEFLLKKIFEVIKGQRIDHDPKAKQHKKPDFVVLKFDIPILYLETKDIGISLDKVEKSDQMDRYYGYTNLVLTDYLEFRFYRNGLRYEQSIKIADFDLKTRTIEAIPENYEHLTKTLIDFAHSQKEPIRSGKHLAKIMGGKAQRIRDNIQQFFSIESDKNSDLMRLYETLRQLLVRDLTRKSFADMYAQTLVYGLFVARYYDKTPDSFSRQEARELIPNSNPLLRHFFDHIVGADFDTRFKYIVDELCEVFSHANVVELVKQYFKTDLQGEIHKEKDPVIHFYEDFLEEYDSALRKKMGAYYTPPPVVQFIVRSVDHLLKKEFGLTKGLADDLKTKDNIHKVQVLDPAVGTGTFISAVIRIIYERLLKSGQKGRWTAYVHHDLLPRIYGFELMITPYTIAHLKLGIAFRRTGFWDFHRRLGIYLTNSLEESFKQQELFAFGLAESIAEESKEAAIIKNDKPIMVVIGNPPYFGESNNKNYTNHDVYKVEPNGGKLQEKNPKWLNDDYVKFIRFAENMIEKNDEGIVGMITAHGYIDNPTFRGMRWHLMKTFNEIYVLDLHGNANKKEKAPDGSKDENVFNIKTGVSIFLGIKKKKSNNNGVGVFKADIFGTRKLKFDFLNSHSIDTLKWNKIIPLKPNYEWTVIDKKAKEEYEKGFSVAELFPISSVGIVTARDKMSIQFRKKDIQKVVRDFQTLEESELRAKYSLGKDAQDWKVALAKKDILENFEDKKIIPIMYRVFDIRWTCYTGVSRGFHVRPRSEVMNNFLKDNLGLSIMRQAKDSSDYNHVLAVKYIQDGRMMYSGQGIISTFPLYVYSDNGSYSPNLEGETVKKIEETVGKVSPEDIFDYIYTVLHSPSYRKKYKEFLKKDFPRVPYPKDTKSFKKLVAFGAELCSLHLLESPKLNQFMTTYPIVGSDTIEKLAYKKEKVFINSEQYFGNVSEVAWNFYIGGYQPAQKWLKDRKGRILTNNDIEHYQKIIVALNETNRIMQEIDKVLN